MAKTPQDPGGAGNGFLWFTVVVFVIFVVVWNSIK